MKDLEISKELLSEVMDIKYPFSDVQLNSNILSWWREDVYFEETVKINIYEFAFKCKEFAFKNKYKIQSQINESNKGHSHITKKNDDCWAKGFFENTEIEAILKASEYILKEINDKDMENLNNEST